MPVVVGAIAANRAIYSTGMGCRVEEIQARWDKAIADPIPPRLVEAAPCHEVILEGRDLLGEGGGLDRLPIPISTHGFDSVPTLSATNVITKDPETGVQNMGTYRAALKATDRLVVRMATRVGGAGGYQHYLAHQQRGDKRMPCAIVLGCPPCVAFVGPQKLPIGVDEFTVAGGLAGGPVNVVRARTVDLLVRARFMVRPISSEIAARSASPSTTISIPTMPTRFSGRWPIAPIRRTTCRFYPIAGKDTDRSANTTARKIRRCSSMRP
jgi:4-hydroxy-3-polyprenylbenzoate decarboxylase